MSLASMAPAAAAVTPTDKPVPPQAVTLAAGPTAAQEAATDRAELTAMRTAERADRAAREAREAQAAAEAQRAAEAKARADAEAQARAQAAAAAQDRATRSAPRQTTAAPPAPAGGNVSTVIAFARAQIGKPYVYGAAGPGSYDCSGLTMRAYGQIGVHLGHHTDSQMGAGRAVSRSQLQPGDLVFPSSGHVGIYIGNNQIIHAPKPGDSVKISTLWAFYTARRIV